MRTKSLGQKLLSAPYIVWSLLVVLAPLGMVVYYAVIDSTGSFSVDSILQISDYTEIFMRSISFGVIATFLCLLIAYPFAYFLTQSKARTQRTMVMLVMLPMWMNFLLRTYAWMTILEDTGIINTFLQGIGLDPLAMINTQGAVLLGMVYNYLPFMILPLYSVMSKFNHTLVEATQDLGGNKLIVLRRVIFPLSIPGIVSGITMVFVPSVSTFYISQKLGGGKFLLIGDVIEMQFQTAYNYHLGASLSLVLMILILISLAAMRLFTGEAEREVGYL